MATKTGLLPISDLRGGQDNANPALSLADNKVVEAINVDWFDGLLARKRNGAATVTMTSSGLTGLVSALIRHTPSADETLAELWAIDSAFKIARQSAGAWSSITPSEAPSANAAQVYGASLNGKLFLTYKSAVDRLHVWDGTSLRKAGLTTPNAPTAADSGGAGTFAGTRYYQVAYTVKSGSTILRRSERSATRVFTPSGANASATVTKPVTISEGETHWELYASIDNLTFFLIAETAVGTATYVDSATDYSGGTPYEAGTNTVPISAKFITADENRLILGGSWETEAYRSRIWWTPVIGSLDIGDDERVVNTTAIKNYLDIDRGNGGGLTGLSENVNGNVYAFKLSQFYKLVRTQNVTRPYVAIPVSKTIGAITQKGIVSAFDETGAPALYFWSLQGPQRVGSGGLKYLGDEIEDILQRVNKDATTTPVHGVYHADRHQVWWWVAVDGANEPALKVVFDIRLGTTTVEGTVGGWSQHNGPSAAARCSAMFSDTTGASNSLKLKPYIGRPSANNTIWKCDTGTDDAGTAFQAYITTRPFQPCGPDKYFGVTIGHLVGRAAAGVTIRVSLIGDFGVETRYGEVVLTPAGSETSVFKKVEDLASAHQRAMQIRIGDAAAVSNGWTLDSVLARFREEDEA